MSFRSEIQELKETGAYLKPYAIPMLAASALTFSGDFLEIMSERHLKRGAFPEPFDIAAHIGNFREGAMGTMGAYLMIGIVTCMIPLLDKSRDVLKRNVRRAAVGAFAVSSAIQVVGEKFELTNNVVQQNTGDPLDAAYGIGWSAVIAAGAYSLISRYERKYPVQEQDPLTQEIVVDQTVIDQE